MTARLQTVLLRLGLLQLHRWSASRWHDWQRRHPVSVSRLQYCLAALLGLSISCGLGWQLIGHPAQTALLQLQAEASALTKDRLQKQQDTPRGALERAQQSRRRLALLEPQLADNSEQLAIMREIDALGVTYQLKVTLFKPEPQIGTNQPGSMLFGVIGTFQSIVRFTDEIAKLPHIVILDRLQLQPASDVDSPAIAQQHRQHHLLELRAAANTYPHALAVATSDAAASAAAINSDSAEEAVDHADQEN
jgi:Tfp pilus assembly protein PilO